MKMERRITQRDRLKALKAALTREKGRTGTSSPAYRQLLRKMKNLQHQINKGS